ncbi:hypothetical protein [Oceanirhabdus sp. W0125-5]|uniref:hypothetical protein n=1 Tax=Oceanirhabdus sp. W0125-5 TaxID=2999116 RepID=UPI0022F2A776|nr:hypothetical protein [Oceanirhabdus sp. W0125-5]WBW96078.1 hypothetical protein OW730_20640 [Oceanirhabdus sp. W0125-5]
MKEYIPFLIGMSISGLIFMNISIKFSWSQRLWAILNKKINPSYNATTYLLTVVILQSIIQVMCDGIGMTSVISKTVLGFTMGFSFAFIPYLDKK